MEIKQNKAAKQPTRFHREGDGAGDGVGDCVGDGGRFGDCAEGGDGYVGGGGDGVVGRVGVAMAMGMVVGMGVGLGVQMGLGVGLSMWLGVGVGRGGAPTSELTHQTTTTPTTAKSPMISPTPDHSEVTH